MASISNPNGNKVQFTNTYGTPFLIPLIIYANVGDAAIAGGGASWNETTAGNADSNESKAVRAIAQYCEIYETVPVNSGRDSFTIMVRASSVPTTGAETLDPDEEITKLSAAVVAAIGSLGSDGGVFVGNSGDERYWA